MGKKFVDTQTHTVCGLFLKLATHLEIVCILYNCIFSLLKLVKAQMCSSIIVHDIKIWFGVGELKWSAQSPDLNYTEHLWNKFKYCLWPIASSMPDPINALLAEWAQISTTMHHNLGEIMQVILTPNPNWVVQNTYLVIQYSITKELYIL